MEKREIQTPVILFDKYEVVRKIGGQENRKFSTVFECINTSNSKKVICKAISKEKLSESALKKIRLEAGIQFNHPRIINTIERFEKENFIFLFFNFIEGIPLSDFVANNRRRKRKKIAPWFFEQAFELIEHVHNCGYLHNDIKPENFLIYNEKVYLIDFGLVQKKDDIILGKTIFAMGFSAPELVLNYSSILTDQSDYFSLGVCLWYLFAGDIPLRHEHPAFFINLQITHPIPEHRNIPKAWFEIISELCHKVQFPVPPNQMKREDVVRLLQDSISRRPDNNRMRELIDRGKQI